MSDEAISRFRIRLPRRPKRTARNDWFLIKRFNLILLMLIVLSGGCFSQDLSYMITAGLDGLLVVVKSVPVDEAINDPNMSEENRDKLRFIQDVRDYAEIVIGLNVRKSYEYYYDTNDQAAIYNLSASYRDRLEPLSWEYPFLGWFEYRGYFDLETAKVYGEDLKSQGYDVVMYGAIAYSTGGILRDPIYSSLLTLSEPLLADTVVHELTHNTIFRMNDSVFNESVANFVGHKGSLDYLKLNFGEDSDVYKQAVEELEDQDRVNDFLAGVYQELNSFYSRTELSSEEKILQREDVFQLSREKFNVDVLPFLHDNETYSYYGELPTNNAWILLNRRYNSDNDLFEQVFNAAGKNLAQTVLILKEASKADDAEAYLRQWLGDQ
jgi:predicted aminopeptidase